ncbi:MAG: D-alanine--D-alanine ligase family protein [Candidatus Sumerlaeia bacterium]
MIRIALIFGGVSPEHDISISSASQVAEGLRELAKTRPLVVRAIYITRDGDWVWGPFDESVLPDCEFIKSARRWDVEPQIYKAETLDFAQSLARLSERKVDVALMILHGTMGEDGRIQGALDLAGIKYAGSGAAASALALDKARCLAVLNSARLPIAPSVLVQDGQASAENIEKTVGFPCVVKPSAGGSSVGVTIVQKREELAEALARACEIDRDVVVEQYVPGREFTCGLLERDGELIALPVIEIVPPPGRFFDLEAKYTPGMTQEICPAPIPDELARSLQTLARAAHLTLGCRGFSRVDFIADPSKPTIIEINTIPGMTATSLLPQAAKAIGIDFPSLIGLMLDSARHD